MSVLLVEELKTTLQQEVIPESTQLIRAVRIDLLKYGNPSGSLKVTIKDQHNNTVASSSLIAISSISPELYYHGFIRFDLSAHLKANTTYSVILSSQGYIFSDSQYIAWKRDYSHQGYNLVADNSNGFESAFSLEFWAI